MGWFTGRASGLLPTQRAGRPRSQWEVLKSGLYPIQKESEVIEPVQEVTLLALPPGEKS